LPRKYTIDEIKEKLNYLGYEWIDGKYESTSSKLKIKDKNGYMYETSMKIIINGYTPDFVSKYNSFSIENIKLWCEINNKNFMLVSDEYETNNKNLQWKCNQEECGEIFDSPWSKVISNRGCPYCSGQKVGISNCLVTKNPQLVLEWHPTKNINFTPYDVTCGSDKMVWWKCENDHEWKTTVSNRTSGKKCPYCYGNVNKTHNQFIKEVCELVKNEYEILSNYVNAHTKVLIRHNFCNTEYKVKPHMFINNGRRCPVCCETKGEKKLRKWLEDNKVPFIPQKEFDGLKGTGGRNLSYDFYLPNQNVLIEYQGQFHDGSNGEVTKLNLEKQQEHDKRKRDYAKQNCIKLLEIWYWDYDNIENILEELNVHKIK
jgi:hypothetical protein